MSNLIVFSTNNAHAHIFSQDDNVSPILQIVDESASFPSGQQVRWLTTRTAADDVGGGVDIRLPAALLLDRLLEASESNARPPATKKSLMLRRLVKRQPYQCLVNVVACWKR